MAMCSTIALFPVLAILMILSKTESAPMDVAKLHHSERLFEDDFLKEGSSCTRGGPFDYPKCEPGTWCVGNTNLKCVRRKMPGESCTGEYEECVTGSTCNIIGYCELVFTMMSHYIAENGTCTEGQLPRCFPGFWCIENVCRRLQPCGKPCDESFQICREGLTCKTVQATGKKICTRDFGVKEVAQISDPCGGDNDPPCAIGLRCATQDDGTKQCARPKRLGQTCTPGRDECETGRVCTSLPKADTDSFCADIKGVDESCADGTAVCATGLTCTRVNSDLLCK